MLQKYILPLKSHLNRDLAVWTGASLVTTAVYTIVTTMYFPDMMPIITEIIGTFLTLTCVGLITKQNLWCWPFGIGGVILLGYAFFVYGLISTAILHIAFFLPMQFHGWYQWMNGEQSERQVSSIGVIRAMLLMAVIFAGPALVWAAYIPDIAAFLGDSVPQIPLADSAIMWFSVAAQILMNYKILENWIFWIVLDIIAVIIYFISGMYMVSALYMIFLYIAGAGLLEWSKDYRRIQK